MSALTDACVSEGNKYVPGHVTHKVHDVWMAVRGVDIDLTVHLRSLEVLGTTMGS